MTAPLPAEEKMHWSDPRQLQFAKNMALAATRRGEDMMAINVHFLLALISAAQNFVGSSADVTTNPTEKS